jgi:hypothetical protein
VWGASLEQDVVAGVGDGDERGIGASSIEVALVVAGWRGEDRVVVEDE